MCSCLSEEPNHFSAEFYSKNSNKIQSRFLSSVYSFGLSILCRLTPGLEKTCRNFRCYVTHLNASRQSKRRVNLIHSYALRWLKQGVWGESIFDKAVICNHFRIMHSVENCTECDVHDQMFFVLRSVNCKPLIVRQHHRLCVIWKCSMWKLSHLPLISSKFISLKKSVFDEI